MITISFFSSLATKAGIKLLISRILESFVTLRLCNYINLTTQCKGSLYKTGIMYKIQLHVLVAKCSFQNLL